MDSHSILQKARLPSHPLDLATRDSLSGWSISSPLSWLNRPRLLSWTASGHPPSASENLHPPCRSDTHLAPNSSSPAQLLAQSRCSVFKIKATETNFEQEIGTSRRVRMTDGRGKQSTQLVMTASNKIQVKYFPRRIPGALSCQNADSQT